MSSKTNDDIQNLFRRWDPTADRLVVRAASYTFINHLYSFNVNLSPTFVDTTNDQEAIPARAVKRLLARSYDGSEFCALSLESLDSEVGQTAFIVISVLLTDATVDVSKSQLNKLRQRFNNPSVALIKFNAALLRLTKDQLFDSQFIDDLCHELSNHEDSIRPLLRRLLYAFRRIDLLTPNSSANVIIEETKHWQSRVFSDRPNDLIALVDYEWHALIQGCTVALSDPQHQMAKGAFYILLTITSGLPANELRDLHTQLDSMKAGFLRRNLKLPENASQKSTHSESANYIELPLPKLVKEHAGLFSINDNFSTLQQQFLAYLRARHIQLSHLTQQRLARALEHRLNIKFRSLLVTYVLASRINYEPPILAYYLSVKLDDCVSIWRDSLADVGLTSDIYERTQGIYGYSLDVSEVRTYVADLLTDVDRLLNANVTKNIEHLANAHNAYTRYIAFYFQSIAGLRPLNGIFPHQQLYNQQHDVIFIDDKQRIGTGRVVTLPVEAKQLVRHYKTHTLAVQRALINLDRSTAAELVTQHLSRGDHSMFFAMEKNGTITEFKPVHQGLDDAGINLGRKVFALHCQTYSDDANASRQLGHASYSHDYSPSSSRSKMEIIGQADDRAQFLLSLGLTPIAGLVESSKNYHIERSRLRLYDKAKTPTSTVANDKQIDPSLLELSPAATVEFLVSEHGMERTDAKAYVEKREIQISERPHGCDNVIFSESIRSLEYYHDVCAEFPKLIAELVTSRSDYTKKKNQTTSRAFNRTAQYALTYSLIRFSGISNKRLLTNVFCELTAYRGNSRIISINCDARPFTFAIDHVSLSILTYIQEINEIKIDLDLNLIKPPTSHFVTLNLLLKSQRTFNLLNYNYETASILNYDSVMLSPVTYTRELNAAPLAQSSAAERALLISNNPSTQVDSSYDSLSNLLHSLRGRLSPDASYKRQREFIAKSIELALETNRLSLNEAYVADWIVYMCRVGTQRKLDPAVSTILTYFSSVLNVFRKTNIAIIEDELPGASDDRSRREVLSDYFNQHATNDSWLSNRVDAFALYVNQHYGLDFPRKHTWHTSNSPANMPRNNSISLLEHEMFIEQLNDDELILYTLLACGGLRLQEALGLTLRDILLDSSSSTLHVFIAANTYRKIKNGRTRTVTIGSLSTTQITSLTQMIDRHTKRGDNVNDTLILGRNAITVNYVHESLIRKLRLLTGDLTLSAHSLRHFALNQCDLITARNIAGHSSVTTTLANYRHRNPMDHSKIIDSIVCALLEKIPRKELNPIAHFLNVKPDTLRKRVYRSPSSGLSTAFEKSHSFDRVSVERPNATGNYRTTTELTSTLTPIPDLLDSYLTLLQERKLPTSLNYLISSAKVAQLFKSRNNIEIETLRKFTPERSTRDDLRPYLSLIVKITETGIVFPSPTIAQQFTISWNKNLGTLIGVKQSGHNVNFKIPNKGITTRVGTVRIIIAMITFLANGSSVSYELEINHNNATRSDHSGH